MARRTHAQTPPGTELDRFNALPDDAAQRELLACCSSPRWAQAIAAGRPYASAEALYRAADRALAELADADIDAALDSHPRIGERRDGDVTSAREQAAVGRSDVATRQAIAEGNRRYEERFGQVYLVAASGRSAEDLLDDLHRRLGHDPETERAVLRRELATITRTRLRDLAEPRERDQGGFAGVQRKQSHPVGGHSAVTTHVLDSARGVPASGVPVRLERLTGGGTEPIASSTTDADGRARDLGPDTVEAGTYRLVFDTGAYFAATGQRGFYPEVAVTFTLPGPEEHCHVPVLLSPYAYSTYRGS